MKESSMELYWTLADALHSPKRGKDEEKLDGSLNPPILHEYVPHTARRRLRDFLRKTGSTPGPRVWGHVLAGAC